MGKIYTKPQHDFLYKKLVKAEGEQCIRCHFKKKRRVGPPKTQLIIEHADNNHTNTSYRNIHLCCKSCNKEMESTPVKEKIEMLCSYSDQIEKERERKNLPTWKTVLAEDTDYEGASTEIQLGKKYKPRWLEYVHKELSAKGFVFKKALIVAAAKKAGCAKQTSTNYLEVETSEEGPFMETMDNDGNIMIVYRKTLDK